MELTELSMKEKDNDFYKNILEWVYKNHLLAKNKTESRAIIKKAIDRENGKDYSKMTSDKLKNHLRPLCNSEKRNPQSVVNYIEKIIQNDSLEPNFSIEQFVNNCKFAEKFGAAIFSVCILMKPCCKDKTGGMLELNKESDLSYHESIFFHCIAGLPIISVKCYNRQEICWNNSDLVYNNPSLASRISKMETFRNYLENKGTEDKATIHIWLIITLLKYKIGKEKATDTANVDELWTTMNNCLRHIHFHIKKMPVKLILLNLYDVNKPTKLCCLLDVFNSFSFAYCQLCDLFLDKHVILDYTYLSADYEKSLWMDCSDSSIKIPGQYNITEMKRMGCTHCVTEFTISKEKTETKNHIIELRKIFDNDDKQISVGCAIITLNIDPLHSDAITESVTSMLIYTYNYIGDVLTFIRPNESEPCLILRRINPIKLKTNEKEAYLNYSKIDFNSLDKFFERPERQYKQIADISITDKYIIFAFKDFATYRIEIKADPRLKFLRCTDLTYLYKSPNGDEYICINNIGNILINDMDKIE